MAQARRETGALTNLSASPRLCPICAKPARLALRKEANVCCADYFEGRRLFGQDRGEIDLFECTVCGFAWMPALHAWDDARLRAEIYNGDYAICDPHFEEIRPQKLAPWLAPHCAGRSLLDYGGGEGRLAELLRGLGVAAESYDPFFHAGAPPEHTYDLVTAFEVIEHVGAQSQLFTTLAALLKPGASLIFSTLLKPMRLEGDHWYPCARNGHISWHSAASLSLSLAQTGLIGVSLSPELHVAARDARLLGSWQALVPVEISGRPGFQTAPPWRDFTAA